MKGDSSTFDAEVNDDYTRVLPFFKAIQEKDWKSAVEFVREKHEVDQGFMTSKCKFANHEETIFHIISRNLNVPYWVFEKVQPKSPHFIDNQYGQSPLFMAALSGNIKAAKFFVSKDTDMPNRREKGHYRLPIHRAAEWGHKEIIQFLWKHTTLDGEKDKKYNIEMLKNLINCDHYDIAFELLKKYPNLAREEINDRASILEMLASRPSAFKSGSQLGFWESKIYEWIPVPEEHIPPPTLQNKSVDADEENQNNIVDISNPFSKKSPFKRLCIMLSKPLILVLGIKSLHEKKLKHMHALEIVKSMCNDGPWSYEKASEHLWTPLNLATRLGVCELVDEILKTNYFCYSLHNKRDKTEDILTLAIRHHQEKVFHLITERKVFHWNWIAAPKSKEGKEKGKTVQNGDADGKNSLLHLAAMCVPSNQVSGAAFQMQRELQWFKAVQSFLHPSHQEQRDGHNKTPRELFTEEHKKLVEEGEKWMKDTATSCSVVGALIITVAFAAAFTVPGGNDAEGFPLFLHEPSFIIFIISDALALFSSAASVFTFLGMLTSRYSEDDFLKSLPRKLIFGLITLFFSIVSMMTAFIAAIYILLSDLRSAVFIPIVLLGGLTVVLFLINQLPLVIEMYSSTYRSILNPPRK